MVSGVKFNSTSFACEASDHQLRAHVIYGAQCQAIDC